MSSGGVLDPMDPTYESQRPRYFLCSLGFGFLGVSFVLLTIGTATPIIGFLTDNQAFLAAVNRPWWTFVVNLPMSYGALIGAYLVWGRWTDPSWQRRAGLLLLMNLIDAVSATLLESRALGFDAGLEPDSYLIGLITGIFAWLEFYLSASLAAEIAAQLARPTLADAGRLSERIALIALVIWVLFHGLRTDWSIWPPVQPRIQSLEELFIYLGLNCARILCGAQVATLCLIAAAHCRRTWRELGDAESKFDPQDPLA